jgi:hypothetical protein
MNRHNDEGWFAKLIHVSGFYNYLDPTVQDWVMPADIVVLQRNIIHQQALDAMAYFQGMGKPVVVDLDDAYQSLPWSNPAHRFWHETDDGAALKVLEEGLRQSNGLVAPNPLLLQDWAHVTNGYLLPNFAEGDWWTGLPSGEELKAERGLGDRVVVGWGGSVSHYDSWWGSGIREAAERVARRHPEVLWYVCGNDPRIAAQLPVPGDQKAMQLGVPPEAWPRTVKMFDIGVAPLFGPYDQRRSWIKGLEYLLAGVPWVGTQGVPYQDLASLGTLIPNGADAWEAALEDKLADLGAEQEQAAARVELARGWLVDNQLHTFRAVYGQAIQDYEEYHRPLPGVHHVRPDRREDAGRATEEALAIP